jgi:hypothetical protein
MYNEQDICDSYIEVTDGTRYLAPKTNYQPSEFEQFWGSTFPTSRRWTLWGRAVGPMAMPKPGWTEKKWQDWRDIGMEILTSMIMALKLERSTK